MEHNPHGSPGPRAEALLPVRIRIALSLLQSARVSALELRRSAWEFAVEISQLHAAGVTNTDLRWLLCKGYVEHGAERIRAAGSQRSFLRLTGLAIPQTTCFVLTAQGSQLAEKCGCESAACPPAAGAPDPLTPGRTGARPCWDNKVRRLTWNGSLIKHYRLPATNQEAILNALEEEGWPLQVDDPLPWSNDIDPKARLHDAIKGLNRHQVCRLLVFRGDGTGRGVMWGPWPRA
jgi:hypothetical protein